MNKAHFVELWPAEKPAPVMHATVQIFAQGQLLLSFYQKGEIDKSYRMPAAAATELANLIAGCAAAAGVAP